MIKAYTGYNQVEIEHFTFNGGEEHVRVLTPVNGLDVTVTAIVRNSGTMMQLAMLKDALDRMGAKSIELVIPYFPYARQDRVCTFGESFAVKVMANMINAMEFKKVTISDPHSDVTPALINNVDVIDQASLARYNVSSVLKTNGASEKDWVVVAPDAGASKKSEKLAMELEVPCYQALKTRDPATGQLSGFRYCGEASDIEGKHIIVPDDICDGGGTFIGLGKVLKELKPASMTLYITHGIFSNPDNLEELKELFDDVVVSYDWTI